jgi:hypothetical protein
MKSRSGECSCGGKRQVGAASSANRVLLANLRDSTCGDQMRHSRICARPIEYASSDTGAADLWPPPAELLVARQPALRPIQHPTLAVEDDRAGLPGDHSHAHARYPQCRQRVTATERSLASIKLTPRLRELEAVLNAGATVCGSAPARDRPDRTADTAAGVVSYSSRTFLARKIRNLRWPDSTAIHRRRGHQGADCLERSQGEHCSLPRDWGCRSCYCGRSDSQL